MVLQWFQLENLLKHGAQRCGLNYVCLSSKFMPLYGAWTQDGVKEKRPADLLKGGEHKSGVFISCLEMLIWVLGGLI